MMEGVMRKADALPMNVEQRRQLEAWARGKSISARLVERAKILLMLGDGYGIRPTAEELGVALNTVRRWRDRFSALGCTGIEKDAPGRGRKPLITVEQREEIVRKTTQETPSNATHWSLRRMAKASGLSHFVVWKVWTGLGLKPHLVRTFKLSNDPRFVEKVEDIVGLYLNPPQHAVVLSIDEKSQIQALDRTQPGLPLKKGRCGTMTHDYKRNGTTTLFAALNTLDGTVIAETMPRHRHQEWLKFLRLVERQVPKGKEIHIVCDNYATHKHEKVQEWLSKRKRIHVHFTPTSGSWLNMVERLFRDITENRIRRGVFRSVAELEQAIRDYLAQHNTSPKPFIWTATHPDILGKVTRAKASLNGSAISQALH
jgi:transposase